MPQIPTLLEMLQAGVHFGHKTARRHPKMEPYIFGERSGIHIINLDKTVQMAKKTADSVRDMASRGKIIMFIGTKKQAHGLVKQHAEDCNMPYVTNRWLGGTFTNFSEVSKQIRRYHELKEMRDTGAMARKYTKKEALKFEREIEELEEKVGGIQNLKRLPDAVLVIDVKKEKTALREAKACGVPVIALMDTNVNPDDVDYGIPSNDDAVKTLEMMIALLAGAIKDGQANPAQEKSAAAAPVQNDKVVEAAA